MSSFEAGRAVKRQRTSDPTTQGNVYEALFEWLRKAGAVGLDQLHVAKSDGGVGLFAKCAIACGGAIAEIPQQCVLSAAASWQSDAGRACRRAVTANPSLSDVIDDGFVLALSIAEARRSADHPFHCYAQSLPSEAPSAPYWAPAYDEEGAGRVAVPARGEVMLRGTTLGEMIRTARARIETACDAVQADCDDDGGHERGGGGSAGGDGGGGSSSSSGSSSGGNSSSGSAYPVANADGSWRERVRWAYSMYTSRGFTAVLYHADAEAGADADANTPASANADAIEDKAREAAADSNKIASKAGGVMLPLFDLLNHSTATAIEWAHDLNRVRFRTLAPSGIGEGSEIFNNYGPKSNEELLLHHGFALRDNEHDVYTFVIAVRGSSDGAVTRLGPFYVRRANPRWQQFPDALWKALSCEQHHQAKDAQQGDAGADGDGAVAVSQEEVELLLGTLRQRLQPFAATAQEDVALGELSVPQENGEAGSLKRQQVFAARYRNGQRMVLEEAIETLEEMLGIGTDA